MKTLIYYLLFLSFSSSTFAQTWTVIDSVLIDEEKNIYYKVNPFRMSINNQKVALIISNFKEIIEIQCIEERIGRLLNYAFFIDYYKDIELVNSLGLNELITNLEYDYLGNLWFATTKAIFKYDGQEIEYYTNVHNSVLSESYSIRRVSWIKNDLFNRPWIVVQVEPRSDFYHEYFLCRFENNRFLIHYQYIPNNPNVTSYTSRNLAVDNQNRIWQIANDTVLMHTLAKTSRMVINDMFDFASGSLQNLAVCRLNNKTYLTCRNSGFYTYSGDKWTVEENYLKQGIGELCVDSSGNAWYAPYHLKYFKQDPETGETIPVYNSISRKDANGNWTFIDYDKDPDKIEQVTTDFIAADKKGRIYLAAGNYGLVIFTPPETSSVETDRYRRGLPDVWLRKAYPNPAYDWTRVEFFLYPGVIDEINIELYNVMGSHIRNLNEFFSYDAYSAEGVVDFPVSDLQTGVYLVTISAGKNKRVQKVMVVRH